MINGFDNKWGFFMILWARTADWECILDFSILNGCFKPQAHALASFAYE